MENKLTVIVTKKENEAESLISTLAKEQKSICYVCLSRSHAEIVKSFKKKGIDLKKIIFIDAIKTEDECDIADKNCEFLSGLKNLGKIQSLLNQTVRNKECNTIVFDSISSLLIYQNAHQILKFTQDLVSDDLKKNLQKIFLVLKEKGMAENKLDILLQDLTLFADKTVHV